LRKKTCSSLTQQCGRTVGTAEQLPHLLPDPLGQRQRDLVEQQSTAAEAANLSPVFHCVSSPDELAYLPTGCPAESADTTSAQHHTIEH
jgi:hypothetical protein